MTGIGSFVVFFFQAEDGIRGLVRARGLGDVYKGQTVNLGKFINPLFFREHIVILGRLGPPGGQD